MFGVVVAGRLVQTNFVQGAEPSKFLIGLEKPEEINHLVVFMTEPLPMGFAATVHFFWPNASNAHWQLLGMISNEKPSAIFKLGGKKSNSSTFIALNTSVAQLGISIEPIDQVNAQCSGQLVKAGAPTNTAMRLVQNLFDYCSSFSQNGMSMNGFSVATQISDNAFIPFKVLQDWYQLTLRKISSDPNFLQ